MTKRPTRPRETTGGRPHPGRGRLPEAGLDEEERRLWRRVVADVRPLDAADDAADTGTDERRRHRRTPRRPARPVRNVAPAVDAIAPPSPSVPASSRHGSSVPVRPQQGLDPRTRRALSRGRRSIDRVVDLHGLTREQAFGRLLRELHSARRRGERLVLVVTGKGGEGGSARTTAGAADDGRGILRRQLPLWLEGPELAALVHRHAPAAPRHGGSGAFYLFVRRSRDRAAGGSAL